MTGNHPAPTSPFLDYPYPMEGETFRDVPDFVDYQASTLGRIRSCRVSFRNPNGEWRILKPIINSQRWNYQNVKFRKGGKQYTMAVHRVILETFVGPRPKGFQACHCDGNNQNNRLDNLRWDTPGSNTKDKELHGSILAGERSPLSVLTSQEVRLALCLLYFNVSQPAIARRFKVRREAISKIANRKRWKSITNQWDP